MFKYYELIEKEDLTPEELSYLCGYRDGYYGMLRNSPETPEYELGFDDGLEKADRESSDWLV